MVVVGKFWHFDELVIQISLKLTHIKRTDSEEILADQSAQEFRHQEILSMCSRYWGTRTPEILEDQSGKILKVWPTKYLVKINPHKILKTKEPWTEGASCPKSGGPIKLSSGGQICLRCWGTNVPRKWEINPIQSNPIMRPIHLI